MSDDLVKQLQNPRPMSMFLTRADQAKDWTELLHTAADRIKELEGMLPEDNRPCSTDRFLMAVVDEIDDHHDRLDAIKCWIEGAWDEAVEGTTLAELLKERSDEKGQDQ